MKIPQIGKGRVVTINGSFDIMHAGHVHALKEAKAQGDILIVGLNSDSSVKAYKNGQGPINNQVNRKTMLESIRYVDHVVIFDEPNPIEFIRAIRPDVHCNASSYGSDCIEADIVKEVGARLHLISDCYEGLSSSSLVAKIARSYREPIKAAFLDRDGVLNVDTGYTHKPSDLKIPVGAIKGLAQISRSGYRLIIISNQSGIARGRYKEKEWFEFNEALYAIYEKNGVKFTKAYHCPHHPDFTGVCDCRKPRAGLFRKAQKEFNIDMQSSIMIGDKDSDIIAAKKAGVGRTFLIKSEKLSNSRPDHVVDDLVQVAALIQKGIEK